MQFFVVRHKATQRLLPQSYATGSTWWEPETDSPGPRDLPRLFYSHKAASNCIVMWAKGRAVKQRQGGNIISITGDDDYKEWLEWETVPGRSRDQLEAVPVYLKFGEPLEAKGKASHATLSP